MYLFKITIRALSGSSVIPDDVLTGIFEDQSKEEAVKQAIEFYADACDTDEEYIKIEKVEEI